MFSRIHHRTIVRACAAALLAASAVAASRARAENQTEPSLVPLTKVVLFNAGVGYFERRGEIDGNARIDLKFNVEDINDLLQSMVLSDLGGGTISTVTYGSKEPIARTLQTFTVDLTSEPTLADLLRQIRGERVQVDLPNPTSGIIVGVEKHARTVGQDKVVESETLNLLTDEGLASIPLESVRRIKLLNPQLDAELRQALNALALGHASDKKAVSLNFEGEGRRAVRVGYVQESPIWKTSYRLVLADDEQKPPLLQGWAIVENATEEDWHGVSLTLVSGRPISFVMDLYQSLYVARPVVLPDLFGSLRPRVHDQDLAVREQDFRNAARRRGFLSRAMGGVAGMGGGMGGGGMGGMGAAAAPPADAAEEPMDIAQGVRPAASAAELGELFQYAIQAPVTLARQQSAMLPIINAPVEAQKVSLYNPAVEPKHPLGAIKLINSTELHLMQGPITVFDDGAYAGTARIQDLPPGSERLVSYALDLETEVAAELAERPRELVSVKIAGGVIKVAHKSRRSQKYTVKNSGERAKRLLIERAREPRWTLVEPAEPAEQTRDLYRFAVEAQPGEPAVLNVHEEQVTREEVAVADQKPGAIEVYVRAKEISKEVRAALTELARHQRQIAALTDQRSRLEGQLDEINTEQDRIRKNMAQLDRQGELYARYVKKFSEQEDQVEELRGQIESLSASQAAAQEALAQYVADLEVE